MYITQDRKDEGGNQCNAKKHTDGEECLQGLRIKKCLTIMYSFLRH